jgi:LPS export ABC transporter protein LptC
MDYLCRLKKTWGLALIGICAVACTFDYGQTEPEESPYPDITMEDMEYTRVRNGALVARLQAELAERYEKRHYMELKNYSFEQYNTTNEKIDAIGSGGSAAIELGTSNIRMFDGVEITVDAEDLAIETERLDWDNGTKTLKSGENDTVKVEQSTGTSFDGVGFSADVRSRSWAFFSNASGVYVHEDEDEEEGADSGGGVESEDEADNFVETPGAGEEGAP